jgi:large subunit ribosomal protein L11
MSKQKKVQAEVKIEIPAGKANPAPPIGTALGPRGVNIMDFCKAFNEQTKNMEAGSPVPTIITIYTDRSFTFVLKTPPVAYFLKKHAGIEKGSSTAKHATAGKITMSQIREIAKLKIKDMSAYDIEAAARTIRGSAESMGLEVVDK